MTLLYVSDLRDFVSSDLEDGSLQILLDAAEEAIVARAGEAGSRTEIAGGGGRFVTLSRPASSIASVTETVHTSVTTLATDDYLAHPGGYLLERVNTGTNPRWRWWGRVTVSYTPVTDTATRMAVQVDLIRSALNYNPGLAAEQLGSWITQYSHKRQNHDEEWNSVLSRLDTDVGLLVVG